MGKAKQSNQDLLSYERQVQMKAGLLVFGPAVAGFVFSNQLPSPVKWTVRAGGVGVSSFMMYSIWKGLQRMN